MANFSCVMQAELSGRAGIVRVTLFLHSSAHTALLLLVHGIGCCGKFNCRGMNDYWTGCGLVVGSGCETFALQDYR